jgi:hypothetical protein
MRIDDLLRSYRTCADLYKLEVLSQQSLQTLEWALHDLLDNDPLRSGFESAVAELLSTIVSERLRSTQPSDPSAFESLGQRLWNLLTEARNRHPDSRLIAGAVAIQGIAVIRQCMPDKEESIKHLLASAMATSHDDDFRLVPRSAFSDLNEPIFRPELNLLIHIEEEHRIYGFEHRMKTAIEGTIELLTLHPETRPGRRGNHGECAAALSALARWHRRYGAPDDSHNEVSALYQAHAVHERTLEELNPYASQFARGIRTTTLADMTEIIERLHSISDGETIERVSLRSLRTISYLRYESELSEGWVRLEYSLLRCLWLQALIEHQMHSPRVIDFGTQTLKQLDAMRRKEMKFGEEEEFRIRSFVDWFAEIKSQQAFTNT